MTQANYVGATFDYDTSEVRVWTRAPGGKRELKRHAAPWYFYVPDENGSYTSIFREKLAKHEFSSKDEMRDAFRHFKRRYESDIQPHFKVLMNEYYSLPVPEVHYAFIDIEVDYKKKLGFSSPENPYAPINAVTIYQSWTNTYLTFAVPPPEWDGKLPTKEQQKDLAFGFELNLVICEDELDLVSKMLSAIEDADIISGWNSEFFDLPYIVKRIERIAPKFVNRLCFKGARSPRERLVERFGKPCIAYSLFGRTHLDYLDLFKKFTFEGRTSYSLGNIASEELDIPKLHYDGTLEQLYHRDFAWFCLYNARDVEVLVKLDQKYKFIQLVNQMAHENCVLFENMMGTVKYVETGIALRAHYVHNLIVPDKSPGGEKNEKVEGAIVMTPVPGLHEWLGAVDLTSLYPSVIRALNMSIETFFGQFVNEEDDWSGVRFGDDNNHTMTLADGTQVEAIGSKWREYLRENNLACSAFGTVFRQDIPGMVADTLTYWFAERKRLQAEKKKWSKEAERIRSELGVELDKSILNQLR
jgi:DNA polymerase elongation subunit (family B)